jgi:hypothetical protein
MLFWSDVPGTIRAARRRIPKALLVPTKRRPPALLSLVALGIVALTRFVGRLEWPPRLAGRGGRGAQNDDGCCNERRAHGPLPQILTLTAYHHR